MPERIQLSRRAGWRKPEGARSVTRPGRYGNPFRIGVPTRVYWFQGPKMIWGSITAENNAEAVAYFRDWINGVVEVGGWPRPFLPMLAGLDLACWCKPGEPCHADVLLELANAPALSVGKDET